MFTAASECFQADTEVEVQNKPLPRTAGGSTKDDDRTWWLVSSMFIVICQQLGGVGVTRDVLI